MNFEKIEQAYALLLENVQEIQNELLTNFYDALVEQNGIYLDGNTEQATVKKNNETLKAQTEPLQANHQFTPDSIGFILTFLIDQLVKKGHIDILEIGSGMGNLAETILNNTQKNVDYLGLELDDLLIDISASIADVMDAKVSFVQGDAVRPQVLKESDVIISDLPVGFYPDDSIAARYEVASTQEHTYAHHLLMEQSLKYLKSGGYAIFLAPNDLLTSSQSDLLKTWLQKHAQIVAMIALPESLFGNAAYAKTIFVLKKQEEQAVQPFVYALSDLQDQNDLLEFSEKFQNWSRESEI